MNSKCEKPLGVIFYVCGIVILTMALEVTAHVSILHESNREQYIFSSYSTK